MKSVSFLRNSWRKKENKPSAPTEDPLPPKQAAHTLPRSAIHAKSIRDIIDRRSDALVFPLPNSRRNDTQRPTVGNGDQDVFAETSDLVKARQRSRSVGAQYLPQEIASHPFPPTDDIPPSPVSPVTRPARKSSLPPIHETARNSGGEARTRPSLPRMSSASSLQSRISRTLRPKRSMPELDQIWEGKDADENLSPTQREFKPVGEVEITHVTRRPRSGSSVSHHRQSSKQRFSDLPKSPAPSIALPSVPNAVADLTSPRKSNFPSEITAPISRPNTALSTAYLKDGSASPSTPQQELEQFGYIPQFTPPSEDERPSTPESFSSEFTSEVTLSMFPKPPPLNLPHMPHPQSLSQPPLTPDYTPTVTPTNTTFLPSFQFHHVRRPSPPTSILKKTSSYIPPSPPITPPWPSPRSSSGTFSSKTVSLEALAPTLKIRNSSPHLSSTKLHSAHRPTSSDSSSDKSAYTVSPERVEYNLRQQVLSRAKVHTVEVYQPEILDVSRSSSPETDSQGVQWGYAV